MNHPLTIQEAYQAMLVFLDGYYDRGGRNSEDIAALLSGMSQTVWEDGGTNDPSMWSDWLTAVQTVKNEKNKRRPDCTTYIPDLPP